MCRQLSKAIKDDVARMSDEVEEVAKGVRKIEINQMSPSSHKVDPQNSFNFHLEAKSSSFGAVPSNLRLCVLRL